jgi:CRISPR-associated protein Cmr3
MNTDIWEFAALDTLFFKESRPMESVGGSELQSAFPPPARTLIGAVRTAVGEALDTDWTRYGRDDRHPLRARIGSPESLAPLSFSGPWLTRAGQRLHAIPLALLFSHDKTAQTRLRPASAPQHCDLGHVCLPEKAKPALAGAGPLEKAFVTPDGLLAFLEGREISAAQIVETKALFSQEERLGIARDNASRVTGDGLLYQTRHVRPHSEAELGLAIGVQGLDDSDLPRRGVARLGAEGRLANWQRKAADTTTLPKRPSSAKGIVLVLQTHALFTGGWLPDGFSAIERDGQRLWQGTLGGISLRIVCAVTGKPVREGGWDLVNHCPRPLQSLVPAGSCYFCEVDGAPDAACKALTGLRIGQDTEYGRGELVVGYW